MNILGGLSGLFGGLSQAYDQNRDYQLRSMLANIAAAQAGATPVPDAKSPLPSSVNPMSDPGTQQQTLQDVSNAVNGPPSNPFAGGSSSAPQQVNSAPAASQAPTQAQQIQQGRQAVQATYGGGAADARAPVTPTGAQSGAAAFAAAAKAMPAPSPASPAPAPAAAPASDMSGVNEVIASLRAAAQPRAYMPIGRGLQVPVGLSPQQADMTKAAAQLAGELALQKNQQTFTAGQQEKQQTFESSQQDKSLAAQATLAQIHDKLQRDLSKATTNVDYARIASEDRHTQATLALLAQGHTDTEVSKIEGDLKPYEQQLPTIQSFKAINPQEAKTNPYAAQQALIDAMHLGVGGSSFSARLAKIAGMPANAPVSTIAESAIAKLASGSGLATQQWQQLQQQVASTDIALRHQHASVVKQELSQFPLASKNPSLAHRTAAMFGAPDPAEYKMAGLSPADYNKDAQEYQDYLASQQGVK